MSTVMGSTSPTRPFMYEDLAEVPDDGYRREIVGGALIVNPAPIARHQRASGALHRILWDAAPAHLWVFAAPYDWRLPDGGSVQPDLVVVRREDVDPDGPFPTRTTPLLVVEILSPSGVEYDRSFKRALYERLNVAAYWIVDPGTTTEPPSLTALRLHDGHFELEAEIAGRERFATDWPFPIVVTPSELST